MFSRTYRIYKQDLKFAFCQSRFSTTLHKGIQWYNGGNWTALVNKINESNSENKRTLMNEKYVNDVSGELHIGWCRYSILVPKPKMKRINTLGSRSRPKCFPQITWDDRYMFLSLAHHRMLIHNSWSGFLKGFPCFLSSKSGEILQRWVGVL